MRWQNVMGYLEQTRWVGMTSGNVQVDHSEGGKEGLRIAAV